MIGKVNLDYDADADVLYAWFGDEPPRCVYEEQDNGIARRIDEDGDTTGFLIINFKRRLEDGHFGR